MTASARILRLMLLVLGLAMAEGEKKPARAQFFFPFFFDNRPSRPPRAYIRPHVSHHTREGVFRPRPHVRPHVETHVAPRHEKTARAEEKKHRTGASKKAVEAAAPPVVEGPPPAYEPQLLRLSEIMGALAYLRMICAAPSLGPAQVNAQAKGSAEGAPWRERMESLMNAEGAGPSRREKLAGAYNRGLQVYQFSYNVCTPSARLARNRFVEEGARLAHDIAAQYRAN